MVLPVGMIVYVCIVAYVCIVVNICVVVYAGAIVADGSLPRPLLSLTLLPWKAACRPAGTGAVGDEGVMQVAREGASHVAIPV